MSDVLFLQWVKGPLFSMAVMIFVIGIVLRFAEILSLGRAKNLAVPKSNPSLGGWREIGRRFKVDQGTFQQNKITVIAGYVFHVGLFIVMFLLAAHIALIKHSLGISWPNLPTPVVDIAAVLSMLALVVLLIDRLSQPVKRFLSRRNDYLVWVATFLPLLTGYMTYHHLGLSPQWLLGLHILSVEALLVLFPFSKLMHTFTLFLSRWYNGASMGLRGVKS